MDRFLKGIAEIYYDNLVVKSDVGLSLNQVLFVFPNRRAGLFFRKELRAIAEKNIFAPNVTDINRLAESFSPYMKGNDIELLIILYKAYSKIRSSHLSESESIEPFDSFVSFGSVILSDFNEIDKYLVNTNLLFKNIADIKNLTDYSQFLSEEQLMALESFWGHIAVHDGENLSFKKDFISLWDDMAEVYSLFKSMLADRKIAYEGMIYRQVVEEVLPPLRNYDFKRVVFIGFNSLTATEESIMRHFKRLGMADFYFDYPAQYDDNSAFASTVAVNYKRNIKDFPSIYDYRQAGDLWMPDIYLHGITSVTNQAQIAANVIDELHQTEEDIVKSTMILLADESVLPNLLQTLPGYVKKLNVTMGFPLSLAPISSLIDNVISLQNEVSKDKQGNFTFYYKPILNILTHPYIQKKFTDLSCLIINHITRFNFYRITVNDLLDLIMGCETLPEHKDFFKAMFSPKDSVEDIFIYLDSILSLLQNQYAEAAQVARSDHNDYDLNAFQFELEYVYQYQKYINQLHNCLLNNDIVVEVRTLSSLIAKVTSALKVQFKGEPLEGLQIMGMLEGRLIDYDNIILLGFNDDKVPGNTVVNSMIPYNLRCAYNLPTYDNNDAIFAYNFYRMLYHSKRVDFIYDSRKEGAKSEISRFYYQLKYLMPQTVGRNLNIKHILYNLPLLPNDKVDVDHDIVIEKSDEILSEIYKYRSDRFLSASILKEYINCPLKFYFKAIAKIYDPNEINEMMQADVFGSIYHKAMEIYYDKYHLPQVLSQQDVKDIVKLAFDSIGEENKKKIEITGFNMLTFNILCNWVEDTVMFDSNRTPFEYVKSEMLVEQKFDDVNFTAHIDRIDVDSADGMVNIIDYKTSKESLTSCSLMDMFSPNKKFAQELFQTLLYCYLYQKNVGDESLRLKPCLYKISNIAKDKYKKGIVLPVYKVKVPAFLMSETLPDVCSDLNGMDLKEVAVTVNEYNDIKAPFEWMLRRLLNELFDKDVPFMRRSDDSNSKACAYCPYIAMCDREKEVKR